MKSSKILAFATAVLAVFCIDFGDGAYRRNGEPVNINWVFSLPWDVANTLRLPLGGPLSLILTGGLSIIMFFSLAVSPVYYFLGTPPRNSYSWHDAILDTLSVTNRNMKKPRFLNLPPQQDYPNFVDSVFWLIGEDEAECQKLMVCHSHGFLNYLSDDFLKLYGVFSRRMVQVPSDFKEAIQDGLEDQRRCMTKYNQCSKSLLDISKKAYDRVMPQDPRVIVGVVRKVVFWLRSLVVEQVKKT